MRPRALLVAVLVLLSYGTAGNTAEGVAERDYGFQSLEIFEFREGTRHLALEDVNGDGLEDVLFVNHKAARLEMLLRKPSAGEQNKAVPLLEERFEKRGFVLDQSVKDFEVEDLDGDGRPDLLTIGYQIGLLLRLQKADGSFTQARKIYLPTLDEAVDLDTGDFNEDGRLDIVVSRRGDVEILWNHGKAIFSTRTVIPAAGAEFRNLLVADFDGDEHLDLLFNTSDTDLPLRFLRGSGSGTFVGGIL